MREDGRALLLTLCTGKGRDGTALIQLDTPEAAAISARMLHTAWLLANQAELQLP